MAFADVFFGNPDCGCALLFIEVKTEFVVDFSKRTATRVWTCYRAPEAYRPDREPRPLGHRRAEGAWKRCRGCLP